MFVTEQLQVVLPNRKPNEIWNSWFMQSPDRIKVTEVIHKPQNKTKTIIQVQLYLRVYKYKKV